MHPAPKAQHAFTLIELSIVLVIIGLIVGGVLVGRDLIKAAEIRATIAQIEKFNAAVNTFRGKYDNYLPGNIPPSVASQFGLFTLSAASGFGSGNGALSFFDSQGLPTGCVAYEDGSGGQVNTGEGFVFWRHLSDARLVEGGFGATLTTAATVSISANNYSPIFPQAKVGSNNFINACAFINGTYISSLTGVNFFQVVGESNGGPGQNMSPLEAYRIDQKTDDGKPNTGSVMVAISDRDGSGGVSYSESWAAAAGTGNCLAGGASLYDVAAAYNITAGATAHSCYGVMFRFQ